MMALSDKFYQIFIILTSTILSVYSERKFDIERILICFFLRKSLEMFYVIIVSHELKK